MQGFKHIVFFQTHRPARPVIRAGTEKTQKYIYSELVYIERIVGKQVRRLY